MCNLKYIGTDLKCPICGTIYQNSKKGRTKEYCSNNCKDFSKYLNAMERCLLKINFQNKTGNQIKGQLFTIANNIKLTKK